MFWQTLWALVLGFTLSGVVQAFVSKDRMRASLGDHRPASVARASGFGMVSSSCSYAASAMARSLFAKGADFTSAMVFQVASTNLVVELGVVLLVLLGWQFAVAEFVGGPIMIVLLALAGGMVFTPAVLAAARRRRRAGGHDHTAGAGITESRQEELEGEPWRTKLRSLSAWSDASGYAVADATMLRRELVVGYAVGRSAGRPGARPRVGCAVPPRSRDLDHPGERTGGSPHRRGQLGLLDRQRAAGRRPVERGDQLRRGGRLPLRAT